MTKGNLKRASKSAERKVKVTKKESKIKEEKEKQEKSRVPAKKEKNESKSGENKNEKKAKKGGGGEKSKMIELKEEKKAQSKERKELKKAKSVMLNPTKSETLANKKRWCRGFYVETLDAKKLMRDFCFLRPVVCVSEAMKKHPDKCRYYDIMCPDATRVVLSQRPPENDFIHANWMTMPDGYRYISAQGPMDETTEDFWHMVVTEKSPAIVMICNWIEDGVEKCQRYLPADEKKSREFGVYKVARIADSTTFFEDVKLTLFEVSHKDTPEIRHPVKHYHFVHWQDHSAPKTSKSVLKVLKELKALPPGPPVIHCSAGIGRTATFIGADYGSQRVGQTGELNVLDLVLEMRAMRDKAIQSHHQFLFMIVCFTDVMVSEGVKRNDDMIDLAEFYQEFVEAARKRKEKEQQQKKEEEEKEKEKAEKSKLDEPKTAVEPDQ